MASIYLDYAASTYTDERVMAKMLPFLTEKYGNASSLHTFGREAKTAINEARIKVANCLNCSPSEIIFTSGGTESDNLALIGATSANQNKGKHLIISNVEHHAVLYTARFLKNHASFQLTELAADKYGVISPEKVQDALTKETVLVSIIFANNEIGTINPIKEIAEICQKNGVLFHTDACQTPTMIDLNVKNLGIDLLTLNGNKIYGPRGVGILYVRKGVKITPLIHGGAQEFAKRAGTENTAAIVGMAEALALVAKERDQENKRLTALRDRLIQELLAKVPGSRLNGHPTNRLANNVNISFLNVEGESILLHLDAAGIYGATGSACSSASLDPSHVLLAIGLPPEVAHGSVRLTLGKKTTNEDIDYVIDTLPKIIKKLRQMSPLHTVVADFPDLF